MATTSQPPVVATVPVLPAEGKAAPPGGQRGACAAMREWFSNLPCWAKVCIVIVLILHVAVGGWFFVRVEIQGCGCPEHYATFNQQRLRRGGRYIGGGGHGTAHHDDCLCQGDVFSCKWDCGDGRGPVRGAPGPWFDWDGHNCEKEDDCDGPGAGDVLCPEKPKYDFCDCAGDCEADGAFCDCEEARADSCCGNAGMDNIDSKGKNRSTARHGEGVKEARRPERQDLEVPGHGTGQWHGQGVNKSQWHGRGSEGSRPARRQRAGGRSMALLPLLWSHGEPRSQ